jgi:hypothetical protein
MESFSMFFQWWHSRRNMRKCFIRCYWKFYHWLVIFALCSCLISKCVDNEVGENKPPNKVLFFGVLSLYSIGMQTLILRNQSADLKESKKQNMDLRIRIIDDMFSRVNFIGMTRSWFEFLQLF